MQEYTAKTLEQLRYGAEEMEDMSFDECVFENCTFDATTFVRCRFISCTFLRCSFVTPSARYTDMRFCVFEDCRLIGMNFMTFVNDEFIRDPVSSLKGCRLKYCDFHDMKLSGRDMSSSSYSQCSFSECDLRSAVFRRCDLDGTGFSNCDMRGADFRGAVGYAVDPVTNKLKGSRFSAEEAVSILSGLGIILE